MGKVSDWFWNPLAQIFRGNEEVFEDKSAPALTTTEQEFKIFRPQNFEQYIGQEKVKDILTSYVTAIKARQRVFPHILIYGSAGYGKTTLARIIANMLDVKFIETITADVKDFIDLEYKLEDAEGGILFLDEIHSMNRDSAESFYSIMEDFKRDGENIRPFTLIGATTELGEILKNRRPFYDRFKIIIKLERYNPKELSQIAYQYRKQSFPSDILDDEIYTIVGKNSRGTPRTAIRLTEATVYLNGDIKRVLKNFSIIKEGFTEEDLKVLEYIRLNEKGVGLQGLASYLNTSTENYIYEIEPYLLKSGLIIRTARGRKISDIGVNKITELKNDN